MTINGGLNELSKLTLLACDQAYLYDANNQRVVNPGMALAELPDTPAYDFRAPYSVPAGFIVDRVFEAPATGLKYAAYRNASTNEVIIAMAGSDGPDFQDWAANLKLGWDQWERGARADLLAYLDSLDAESFTGKIHFTGQSLGGALAEYAAFEYVRQRRGDPVGYPNFDASRITLTTFNGLGSRDGLVRYGNFDAAEVAGFDGLDAVAHYAIGNDLVHRLGGGHIGGPVYEFAAGTGQTDPSTGLPVLLDPIAAHRIESGFYRTLASGLPAIQGFQAAQRVEDFRPLSVANAQLIAGYTAGLFNARGTTAASAKLRFMAGFIVMLKDAPAEEIGVFLPVVLTAAHRSGLIGKETYESLTSALMVDLVRGLKLFAIANMQTAAVAMLGALSLEHPDAWVQDEFDAVRSFMPEDLGQAMEAMNGGAYLEQPLTERLDKFIASVALMNPHSARDRQLIESLGVDPDRIRDILFRPEGTADLAGWATSVGRYLASLSGERAEDHAAAMRLLSSAGVGLTRYKGAEISAIISRTLSEWAKGIGNAFVELSRTATDTVYSLSSAIESWRDFSFFPRAAAAELSRADLSPSAHEALREALKVLEQAGEAIVIRPGRASNPFDDAGFDPDVAPLSAGALKEGSFSTFTVYLPYEAGEGGQRVRLELGGTAAEKLLVFDGGEEVELGVDGEFSLTVPEGQREVSFEIFALEDVDANEALMLSAQLVDAAGEATHLEHEELELALDAEDEVAPSGGVEYRGDWNVKYYRRMNADGSPAVDDNGQPIYETRLDTRYPHFDNVERTQDAPPADLPAFYVINGTFQGAPLGPTMSSFRGHDGTDSVRMGRYNGADVARTLGGDDAIAGSALAPNIIFAGAGSDWVEGQGFATHGGEQSQFTHQGRVVTLGDDQIYGGAGDDELYGDNAETQDLLNDPSQAATGLPGDWINGGTGNDRLYGTAGDDVLLGGTGEDLMQGGAGRDVLLGDENFGLSVSGNYWRVMHTNFGDSTFSGFEVGLFPIYNYSALLGGIPGDIDPNVQDPYVTYYKQGGDDVLVGGAGEDILIGQAGDDTLYGGDDDDILSGWEGNDQIVGGDGNDLIAGDFGRYEQPSQRMLPAANVGIAGLVGSSSFDATEVDQVGNDYLDGGAGNDTIFGEGGDDVLMGREGSDTLFGDAHYLPDELHGADLLDGGAGNDFLYGNAGNDRLHGGTDNDLIDAGAGDDHAEGGTGSDSIFGGEGDDTLKGGESEDVLAGDAGGDILYGGAGNDQLDGGEGDDTLYGEAGADSLEGGAGADSLHGGSGEDLLSGGDGDDRLDGGAGIDVLRGGEGDDTYVMALGYGRDIIEDTQGRNRLSFGAGITAEVGSPGTELEFAL